MENLYIRSYLKDFEGFQALNGGNKMIKEYCLKFTGNTLETLYNFTKKYGFYT